MSKTTGHLLPPGTVGHNGRRRQQVVVVAAAAVAVLVTAVIVVWLNRGEDMATTATAPSTTTPAASAEQTTTEAPTTTERPTTTVGASAADALQPFFAAATTLDTQLHAAATAINGGGPPWTGVSQEMADAVQAAALEPVAATVPAGLSRDVLQSVILVYSDLSSRRHAMASFSSAPNLPYEPIDPLAELANGHAAAVRFDDDLADLRSLAESTPPVTVAPPDSRAAAEALIYVQYVELTNGGCDSRGGAVFTRLPALDWTPSTPDSPDIGIPEWDGHVGGIEFSANYNPNGVWDIVIWAC
jgi:hypothetical protein